MTKKNSVHYGTDAKTERQWTKLGYKLKDGAVGERLYSNGHCLTSYVYYSKYEVCEMTDEEKENYKAEQRKQRNEVAKQYRSKKKLKEEEKRLRLEQRLAEEQKRVEERLQAIEVIKERIANNEIKIAYVCLKDVLVFEGGDYVRRDRYYYYKVPADVKLGMSGVFPFHSSQADGEILSFTDIDALVDEEWFPYKLEAMGE